MNKQEEQKQVPCLNEQVNNKRVLGSSRLTSFWSNEERRTVIVTVLFWSDGTVTWAKE